MAETTNPTPPPPAQPPKPAVQTAGTPPAGDNQPKSTAPAQRELGSDRPEGEGKPSGATAENFSTETGPGREYPQEDPNVGRKG